MNSKPSYIRTSNLLCKRYCILRLNRSSGISHIHIMSVANIFVETFIASQPILLSTNVSIKPSWLELRNYVPTNTFFRYFTRPMTRSTYFTLLKFGVEKRLWFPIFDRLNCVKCWLSFPSLMCVQRTVCWLIADALFAICWHC